MTLTPKQERLLRELFGLLAKYSAGDQEAALTAMRSGESVTRLTNLVREASEVVRPHREPAKAGKRKPSTRELLDRDIDKLSRSGSSRDGRIADILAQARDGAILRTSSAILGLLAPLGMRVPRNPDRLALVRVLGENLSRLPDAELDELLRIARDSGDGGSSLQRWTNIIVKGDQK